MSTEVVAIVIPGAVAATAIVATWHQHFRGLDQERTLADLENVRGILDNSAIALHGVAYVLDDVRSYLTRHGGASFFKTDDGTAIYKALRGKGRDLDALVERLSVRLGRDCEVVAAFREADEAVLDIWRAVGLLRLEPEGDGSSSAAKQIRRLNDEQRIRTEASRAAFDDARERFVAAAHTTAGARLP